MTTTEFSRLGRLPAKLLGRLGRLSATVQFVLAGSIVMVACMLAVGRFLSAVLTREVIHDTAIVTALLLDSIIDPVAQGLAGPEPLPPAAIERLDAVLNEPGFRERFPYLEIWRPDGTVAYSNTRELIGRTFEAPAGLRAALAGEVSAQYADLTAQEHVVRGFGTRYLEIYSPIREHRTGRIIGVAEIHEVTLPLADRVGESRMLGWAVVAGTTALMMASLYGIVHRASRTIRRQRAALEGRMHELEQVSEANLRLRRRVQNASVRAAEVNEMSLKRIGADLHDGPSQLVGAAALKLETVKRAPDRRSRVLEIDKVAQTLRDALRELRDIAQGLMLPEIEGLALGQVVERAARGHEAKTGAAAALALRNTDIALSHAVNICVFRFVQEGLMNAFWHGSGKGLRVDCAVDGAQLRLSVADEPRRGTPPARDKGRGGMGLRGLRHRVESLGGVMHLDVSEEHGSRLEMVLDLSDVPSDE